MTPSMGPVDEELPALQEFRSRVSDILTNEWEDDAFLVKWLRARQNDVGQAESMLRQHKQWRQETNMDGILEWEAPEVLTRYYCCGMSGFTSEGCPIVVAPAGRCDIRGLIDSTGKDNVVKYTCQQLEMYFKSMRTKSKEMGKPVTQLVVIFDLAELSLSMIAHKPTVEIIVEMVKLYEAHCPETLRVAHIVNAPRIFGTLYSIIKPLLSERTVNKLQIHSGYPEEWQKAVLDTCPPDQVPPHWGGTKRGTDEFCSDMIIMGGPVPAKYLVKPSGEGDEGFMTYSIPAGQKLDLDYDIKHKDSIIKWTWKSEWYDLGFEVIYNEKTKVVPYTRVDSHVTNQDGSLVCDNPGKYTLSFDNSYSMMRAKTVHYNVIIMSPESGIIQASKPN